MFDNFALSYLHLSVFSGRSFFKFFGFLQDFPEKLPEPEPEIIPAEPVAAAAAPEPEPERPATPPPAVEEPQQPKQVHNFPVKCDLTQDPWLWNGYIGRG